MALARNSLLGLVAACVAHGVAFAQTPVDDAFRAAMTKQHDKAIEILRGVIKANPSSTEAFELWQKVEAEKWQELLMQKGELGKLAQHILLLANAGRKEFNRDEAKIKALVDAACGDDYAKRREAMIELDTKHGEFAVPALLAKIGNADDDKGQVAGIMALRQIGRAATLPMVSALESGNAVLRRNIAAVLNLTKDHRAIPALTALMKDQNEGVVSVARDALNNMGAKPGADAVALFLEQSQNYMVGVGTEGSDISDVVWNFAGGKLSYQDCSPAVYGYELAKKSAERALGMDPGSVEATTLIARSYLAQVAAIDNAKLDALKDGVRSNLNLVAMAMGPKVIGRALESSLRDNQPMVAAAAIRALGDTTDKDALGSSPLLAALDNGNKVVRFAAALAVAKASRSTNVPQADKVVAILGEAVAEQAINRIATVGLDDANKKAVANAVSLKNGNVVEANYNSVRGLVGQVLTGATSPDVVVVNDVLADGIPMTVINSVQRHSPNVKFVLVTGDADKAKEIYGDKIAGTIAPGFKPEELESKVAEALKGVDQAAFKVRAAEVAVKASNALNTLAGNRVSIAPAVSSLETQLQRTDDVAIPAARALGEGGSSIDALLGQITGSAASKDLKVACADAAGKVLGRVQTISPEQFAALKGVAADAKADAGLRTAVAVALGKAGLSTAQRLEVAKALSVMAVAAKAGE